jgi:pyruvate kinase
MTSLATNPASGSAPATTLAPSSAARTKIVATVGPACLGEEKLAELVLAGVDVFRLNMAHGSREEKEEIIGWIRKVSATLGQPVGILVDLAGPKIRLGELEGGQRQLVEGESVRFVRGEAPCSPGELTTTYAPLVDDLAVGNMVMLADGTLALRVEEKTPDWARAVVVQGGLVRSRQGVNLPGAKLSVPAMSDEDLTNANWAAELAIDFVGLSFVRMPVEVRQLKELLRKQGSQAKVVAKIEKQEALEELEAIVDATDAVMVARGDLGVEIDVARMPMVQKRIVAICHRYQKPVIVATQMLDSMQYSRRPTRAEVTDVANAILDGADACMLSGETAIGEHPRLAVEMMNRISLATEPSYFERPSLPPPDRTADGVLPVTQAVVHGAMQIACELSAKAIVAASHSGATALALSKLRGLPPIIGISDSEATLRQMCLSWGVIPLAMAAFNDRDIVAMLTQVTQWGVKAGYFASGDRIVLVAGTGLRTAAHNLTIVHEVK